MSKLKLIEFANSTDLNEPAYYELPQSSSDNLDEMLFDSLQTEILMESAFFAGKTLFC